MLDAWIDFNGNGVFDHPLEHLWGGTSQALATGSHPLTFAVPATATVGATYARFRVSTAGSLPPTGFAADGEVEDYRITIEAAPTTGTIIVEKQTEPDGMSDEFTFTGDANGTIIDGGQIVVSGLAPGAYSSTETVPTYWTLWRITCDDSDSTGDLLTHTANFQLQAGETVKCTFNNSTALDYGDAPDSYKTLHASDGARHRIGGVADWMGAGVDSEADGYPSVLANGDDLAGSDDEDGVTLPAVLVAGDTVASVTVITFPTNTKLDAWIDFNGNGVFDHPAEHLWGGTSQVLASQGSHILTFVVPADATPGTTYARFRLSVDGGLTPTGFAPDGEVEDYQVEIVDAPAAFNKTSPANGATGVAIAPALSWGTSSGADSYETCYGTSTGCTDWTDAGSATSVNLSGLSYNQTYYWQVQAVKGSATTQANVGAYWAFTTGCISSVIVTSSDDSGPGTLRQAIHDVCSGGTITFSPSLPEDTITLAGSELLIDKSLTINGPGADLLSISGDGKSRVFSLLITPPTTLYQCDHVWADNQKRGHPGVWWRLAHVGQDIVDDE